MLGRNNLLHRQSGGTGTGRHGRDKWNCKTKEPVFSCSSEAYVIYELIFKSQLGDIFPNAEVPPNRTIRCDWHTPQKGILPERAEDMFGQDCSALLSLETEIRAVASQG